MDNSLPIIPHSSLKEKRRAYIVLGPEISGTKLLAEIFLKCFNLAGRVGDGSVCDLNEDLIMMRWSLPSGLFPNNHAEWMKDHDRMIDIPSIVEFLKKSDYLPVFVGITRSWMAVTKSRLQQFKQSGDASYGPPDSIDTHLHMVKRGISYFYENVPTQGYPWYMFNYEEITSRPELIIPEMGKFLNLEFQGLDKLKWPIKNQNFKWFKEDEKVQENPFAFDSWP